jgi:hypothetical protein
VSRVGTRQGGMVLDAPLVKAEQHGSIGVEKLTKVGMLRRSRWLAEQRLVPLEARGTFFTPMIVHVRFIACSGGLTGRSTARTSRRSEAKG